MKNDKQINLINKELLSDNWGKLYRVNFTYTPENGVEQNHKREVYDRGNGAVILLYNAERQTVILTRQLRIPTWFNGNANGMMIEACAGMLDENEPEECIRKETEEETGYTLSSVKKIMEIYMSPGSVTEKIYFFTAAYADAMKTGEGGGAENEQENIEVMELGFQQALDMIATGEIQDAKTIILLQYARLHNLL